MASSSTTEPRAMLMRNESEPGTARARPSRRREDGSFWSPMPSIRSSRAAGAKAVSGIAGSGENCVARLFGHAANPVEVDADEFTLPFHHLAGDEHVLDVAGVH